MGGAQGRWGVGGVAGFFSGNERPYRKEICGTTLAAISIDYPQRHAGGVGVR